MDTFSTILGYFLNSWTQILFGFFGFGLAFFIGKQISTSLNVASIIMIMLCFMFGSLTFLFAGLICLILGFITKQGGL